MPDALPAVALAQMEVRAGRPDLNVDSMLGFIGRARAAGAAIVAFPEMCIPGYILGDAWEIDALVEDFEGWSDAIRDASRGVAVVFGNVALDRAAIGEDGRVRKLNAAWVCHDGRFVERAGLPAPLPHGVHPKTLHPNYRFFDDDRHFYSLRKIAGETGTRVSDWTIPYEIPAGGGVLRLGVQLCEDVWHQDYRDRHETLDTLRAWHRAGADLVINLSASPWTWQKNDKRHRVVREAMARSPAPFFYVNQVGAQNNGKNVLVFDGDTCGYHTDGSLAGRAPPWREAMLVFGGSGGGTESAESAGGIGSAGSDGSAESAGGIGSDGSAGNDGSLAAPPPWREAMPVFGGSGGGDGGTGSAGRIGSDGSAESAEGAGSGGSTGSTGIAPEQTEIEAIHDAIVTGLRHLDHVRGCGNRYLIGVSGGIDSGVVACMLRIAFGPERVFAVNMPTRFNAAVTRENARSLCEALGVAYLSCPIEDLYRTLSAWIRAAGFEREPGTYTRLVDENLQARIRGSDVLAGIAAKCGLVFTNNGNKTEVALGYATLYGDVNGAVAPIADLYKTQVFALARAPQRDGVPARGHSPQPHRRRDRAERGAVRGPGRHPGAGRSDQVRIPRRPAAPARRVPAPSPRPPGVVSRGGAAGAHRMGRRGSAPGVLPRRPRLRRGSGMGRRAATRQLLQAHPGAADHRAQQARLRLRLARKPAPRLRAARLGAGETGAAVRWLRPGGRDRSPQHFERVGRLDLRVPSRQACGGIDERRAEVFGVGSGAGSWSGALRSRNRSQPWHVPAPCTHPPVSGASNTADTSAAKPSSSAEAAVSPRAYLPCSTYASPRSTSTVSVSSRGSAIQYSGIPASA